MGYHVIDPGSLSPTPDHPCDRRSLTEAADLETLAAAVYELAPGEQLPRTYHYHEQREELFYVLSGRLHVETPEGELVGQAGEAVLAEPDSPHRAYNPADAPTSARVLGVGAPRFDLGKPYDPGEADGTSGDGDTDADPHAR